MDFEKSLQYVLRNEGGLVDNPNDPGGITNLGISLRFLKSIPIDRLNNYNIHTVDAEFIINLTVDQARPIYKGEFWDLAPFDKIQSQNLCNFIFDMSVNMGIAPAIKCAQRAVWSVLQRREIVDDGILGEDTLTYINRCSLPIMPSLRSERAGYYRSIVAKHPERIGELEGWLNRAYGK